MLKKHIYRAILTIQSLKSNVLMKRVYSLLSERHLEISLSVQELMVVNSVDGSL